MKSFELEMFSFNLTSWILWCLSLSLSLLNIYEIDFELYLIGSLKYWYERNKVDISVSNSAVWDDDAVHEALTSAAFWTNGLPFVKSLSGHWKFFLASSPADVPLNFHKSSFQDSKWEAIPGKHVFSTIHFQVFLSLFIY